MIPTSKLDTAETPLQDAEAHFRLPLVLGLGLPLALFCFTLVVSVEQVYQQGIPTGFLPYFHVIILFALVVLANTGWVRFVHSPSALTKAELLCLYSMMAVGSTYAGWEAYGTVIPSLAYPAAYQYHHSPDAPWAQAVLSHLPTWLVVNDPRAANAVLQGGVWREIWPAWTASLIAWGLISAILFLVFLALSRLLFDAWAYHEKLSFPLTRLPLEMIGSQETLWRSRLFWGGFALAAVVDGINGIHQLYPTVPALTTKVSFINTGAATPAANAVGPTPLTCHPLMLGLAFLLPTDLLFSTWFFYLVGRCQLFLAGTWNLAVGNPWQFGGNFPGLHEQNLGAIVVLSLGWLWMARRHLGHRWQEALAGDREARSDYALVIGGVLLFGAVLCAAGLPVWAAVLAIAFVFLLGIFVARLRAELGLPLHNLQFLGPSGSLTAMFGSQHLSAHGLEALGAFSSFWRSQQGHPMPHEIEARFLAERSAAGISRSRYWWAVGLTGVVTTLAGPWLFLYIVSGRGLEHVIGGTYNPIGEEGWRKLGNLLHNYTPMDGSALREMAVGSAVTLLLIVLRRYWLACPLHPIGYAICGSWEIGFIAVPFCLAWAVKTLMLRYGGLSIYRQATALALGLILGEFFLGAFWLAVGAATGAQTYRIWLF